uniref:hypothetical protein n=1 Tax=Prevotella fusca TaxID=589436 RepID=UPI003FA103AF
MPFQSPYPPHSILHNNRNRQKQETYPLTGIYPPTTATACLSPNIPQPSRSKTTEPRLET